MTEVESSSQKMLHKNSNRKTPHYPRKGFTFCISPLTPYRGCPERVQKSPERLSRHLWTSGDCTSSCIVADLFALCHLAFPIILSLCFFDKSERTTTKKQQSLTSAKKSLAKKRRTFKRARKLLAMKQKGYPKKPKEVA